MSSYSTQARAATRRLVTPATAAMGARLTTCTEKRVNNFSGQGISPVCGHVIELQLPAQTLIFRKRPKQHQVAGSLRGTVPYVM